MSFFDKNQTKANTEQTEYSLRPIDYCPFPPNTPERDRWINDYMTRPLEGQEGEFALRPIDYCPFPPNTPERDRWINDYMTKPINNKTDEPKKITPAQAAKNALKTGTTSKNVDEAHNMEIAKQNLEKNNEGVTKDD